MKKSKWFIWGASSCDSSNATINLMDRKQSVQVCNSLPDQVTHRGFKNVATIGHETGVP